MTEYEITLTGFDELIQKVEPGSLLGPPIRNFFKLATLATQYEVQSRTKIWKGPFRASITPEVDSSEIPQWGKVGTNMLPLGYYIEYDTSPHWPPPGALAEWAEWHGMKEFLVQRAISIHGTKGAFMFRDGFEAAKPKVEALADQAAKEIEVEFGK